MKTNTNLAKHCMAARLYTSQPHSFLFPSQHVFWDQPVSLPPASCLRYLVVECAEVEVNGDFVFLELLGPCKPSWLRGHLLEKIVHRSLH